MQNDLHKIIAIATNIKNTIKQSNIPDNTFDQMYGWNHIHMHKSQLIIYIENFITRLNSYLKLETDNSFLENIEMHTENLVRLNNTIANYFTNNGNQTIYMVPSIILTFNTISFDIDSHYFSWKSIEDQKLVPSNLKRRLRSINERINTLETESEKINEKVDAINAAYDAATSLPVDLADLNEAKEKLTSHLSESESEIRKAKDGINQVKDEIQQIKVKSDGLHKESMTNSDIIKSQADTAKILVDQCDDALQITTTQGLAAGFDQKAKELRNSIWIWIIGLLVALGVGAYMGSLRVDAFTKALENDISAGQALLHTIVSIFSIGGPLWLAWISTQQINQRFKLSEDYSYKATVAKSFTGFKKFAERFDLETEQRLFNSALDRLDEMPLRLVEGKDYNSPWHEFIDSEAFKMALKMVPTLAQEAGRFANLTKLKKKPKETPTALPTQPNSSEE